MALLQLSACVWPLRLPELISIELKTGEKSRKDRVDGRHRAISGLSMILNDTIKRGRNSHFILARERTKMMTSRSVHEAGRSDSAKRDQRGS